MSGTRYDTTTTSFTHYMYARTYYYECVLL